MAEPRSRRRRALDRPFPGLRPFLREEHLIFFGREGQTDDLIDRLRKNHFLAVLGSSGSGKSSLVRAGLLPALEGGLMSGARTEWKMSVIRPGDKPIAALAESLATLVENPEDPAFSVISPRTMMETMLQASSFGLKEAAMGPLLRPNENLLVVVDQFEEIFRFNEGQHDEGRLNEARAFVRLLLEATSDPELPIYVVITMRSDFLGECPRFKDLPEAINAGQYLVPRLTRTQLREAITGPIAVFKGSIAPDLVIRLLNDLGDNSDQLPILQHALMRTWSYHKPGEEITVADYEAIGGLSNALNQHAEEIYHELRNQDMGIVTELLFKCLTHMEIEGKGIRRPTRLSEVCASTGANEDQLKSVVEAFRGAGRSFLMPPREVELTTDTILDISHESFMRLWARLGEWVREEYRSSEEYQRLSSAALDHKAGKVNLWRQPELGIALKWQEVAQPTKAWAARYDAHFELAMEFLKASLEAWDKEETDKAAVALLRQKSDERRKTVRRLVFLIFIMGAGLTFTLGALFVAWQQKRRADTQTTLAEGRADTMAQRLYVNDSLRRIQSQNLDSIKNLNGRNDTLLVLLGYKLDTISRQKASLDSTVRRLGYTNDSLDRIRRKLALNNQQLGKANSELSQQRDKQDSLRREAEDGRSLANRRAGILEALQLAERSLTAPNDCTAILLARTAFALLDTLNGELFDTKLYTALQSSNERFGPMIERHLPIVPMAMVFDSERQQAAILALGGQVWQYEGSSRYFYLKWQIKGNDVRMLHQAQNMRRLLAATPDNAVRVYDYVQDRLIAELRGHKYPVTGALELPGLNKVLSCDIGGCLLLWNMDGKEHEPAHVGKQFEEKARFHAMALSPLGNIVALAKEKEILLLNVETVKLSGSIKVEDKVTAIAFHPNGNLLAFGMENGGVGFHNFRADPGNANRVHAARVSAIQFSPDGRYVASASYDQTLRLWQVNNLSGVPIVLKGHLDWVTGLGYSRDSKMLYSVSKDKTMRYWYTDPRDLSDMLGQRAIRQEFTPFEVEYYQLQQAPKNLAPTSK